MGKYREEWKPVTVRFPPDQYALLRVLAEANQRPLAVEVRNCVERVILQALAENPLSETFSEK
ncbi:hypothetical protein DRO42_07860 [Candidatus Bathyarchaeota archaeon]|nr:MAG: hypothetical protein DRO42_07860 [Candidatus Bathyarchaeota archaeon]